MKKTLITGLAVFLMIIGMTVAASATVWETTTLLNKDLFGAATFDWTMEMTKDFEIPYDTVNQARLSIYSNWVDGNNDKVYVETIYVGKLKNDTTGVVSRQVLSWFGINTPLEVSTFNLAETVFNTTNWPATNVLDVSLKYNEPQSLCGWFTDPIHLDRAYLYLDYTNKSAPVPEPGTMVLLGFGMLGLVVYGKRRMNRDV